MGIYWVFFIVLFISYNTIHPNRSERNLTFWNFTMGFFVFLLFAFRNISMGLHDVYDSYAPTYQYLGTISFGTIFTRYSSDWLFYIVSKFIRIFTENTNVWMAFMALPICIAVGKLIRSCSFSPWISWILFFSLGFFSVNITVMRQSVAMAFVILAVLQLDVQNIRRAFLYAIIASLFHLTAVVVIIPIIIYLIKPKLTLKKIVVIVGVSLVTWGLSSIVVNWLFDHISMLRFQRYLLHLSSFNITMFLVFLSIFIYSALTIYISDKGQEVFNYDTAFIFILGCGLPFYALTSSFADLYRIGLYFSIFGIITVPNALMRIRRPITRLAVGTVILTVVLLYAFSRGLADVSPYITCWSN